MKQKTLWELEQCLETEGIILMFKGAVTPHVTASMLAMAEQRLEEVENNLTVRKRVFNIMVECLDNLFRHSETVVEDSLIDPIKRSSLFALRATKHGYTISTGNYLDIEHMQMLRQKLNAVNGLAKEELKNYYRNILQTDSRSLKGGAGLGIVDIARRSKNKLEYTFDIISPKRAYFSLQASIETI